MATANTSRGHLDAMPWPGLPTPVGTRLAAATHGGDTTHCTALSALIS
ncbi:MAG: hypothetical protein AAF317_01285 [Pseudomonadota bacterium]